MRDCQRSEKDLKEQAKHYQKTPSSDDSELLKQFVNFMNEFKKTKRPKWRGPQRERKD